MKPWSLHLAIMTIVTTFAATPLHFWIKGRQPVADTPVERREPVIAQ